MMTSIKDLKPLLKLPFLIVYAFAVLASLTACHTVEGAGRDIESAGDAIEDSARDSRRY